MQKILRSIKRGQGPTPFKDAFELELFHVPLQRRLDITVVAIGSTTDLPLGTSP